MPPRQLYSLKGGRQRVRPRLPRNSRPPKLGGHGSNLLALSFTEGMRAGTLLATTPLLSHREESAKGGRRSNLVKGNAITTVVSSYVMIPRTNPAILYSAD